jgi:hypothetical protein
MSYEKRVRQVRLVLALLIGLAFVVSASADEQQLSDLSPLVGKWKGWTKAQGSTNIAMEMEVHSDGSYLAVVYFRGGARNYNGTFSLMEGKLRFKSDQGRMGGYVLLSEAGKRVLKGGPDDGSSISELEAVK